MQLNSQFIPFSRPTIEAEEINEVIDSLTSGWISTGPKVSRLEQLFLQRLNVKDSLAVSSGTAAWHILARCLDISPGDEVIIPSITWPSMANVVELLGATPVFADVDKNTVLMKPSEVDRLLNHKTKAILPVHFAGAPADIDAYKAIIANRKVAIVEDAAHAIGSQYKGEEIGSNSDAVIFSFHPTKNITTGEGGLLICKDSNIMNRARSLSLNGIGKSAWERLNKSSASYELNEPGYKYNMLDIQAALGIHQLQKLDKFIEARTQLAERYQRLLSGIAAVKPIGLVDYSFKHSWHIFVVKLDLHLMGMSRNEIIDKLKSLHIGVGVHFEAVHMLRYYREKYNYSPLDLPVSTELGSSIISLPLHPGLTFSDQDRVINALQSVSQ
ncbi:MAG: aminotransferase class I/II-fold pyridoxal phosphate-dependent enzyme [Gammaproteobacteria bacterium]|nr:aminotransferase class I/II-fold pyridoxal phosphate-dependent enzyme [Gammaproteobacteria bacterium]